MLLPSFEVSVLRIEYSSTRMILKTHHIHVVLSHVLLPMYPQTMFHTPDRYLTFNSSTDHFSDTARIPLPK